MLRIIIFPRRLLAVVVAVLGANALFLAYKEPTAPKALANAIGGVMFFGIAIWLWTGGD
jgi:hypothetical protein